MRTFKRFVVLAAGEFDHWDDWTDVKDADTPEEALKIVDDITYDCKHAVVIDFEKRQVVARTTPEWRYDPGERFIAAFDHDSTLLPVNAAPETTLFTGWWFVKPTPPKTR